MIALKMVKSQLSFGWSGCNRVKNDYYRKHGETTTTTKMLLLMMMTVKLVIKNSGWNDNDDDGNSDCVHDNDGSSEYSSLLWDYHIHQLHSKFTDVCFKPLTKNHFGVTTYPTKKSLSESVLWLHLSPSTTKVWVVNWKFVWPGRL